MKQDYRSHPSQNANTFFIILQCFGFFSLTRINSWEFVSLDSLIVCLQPHEAEVSCVFKQYFLVLQGEGKFMYEQTPVKSKHGLILYLWKDKKTWLSWNIFSLNTFQSSGVRLLCPKNVPLQTEAMCNERNLCNQFESNSCIFVSHNSPPFDISVF